MRRALLVALSAVAVVSEAGANGIDHAPLRGSAVYEAPSYPVDLPPGAYPEPVEVEPGLPPPGSFVPPPRETASLPFTFEVGGRYWYSFGNLKKSLYDIPESSQFLISRLTYNGLAAHSGELFARADHPTGFLVKGYVGLTGMQKGTLNDEDFSPFIDPYSSTMSTQKGGHLNYATIDLGYTVYRTPQASLAGIVGYNYLGQKANAYGCVQVATNPFVCAPAIDDTTLAITEQANFHSLRLGVAGELILFDRLRFNAEAAWVPFVKATAQDTHWLRSDFISAIPENGRGEGLQVEASMAFQATQNLSIGAGWRYWHLDTKGNAEFASAVGAAVPAQPLNFTTDRSGFFLQAAYRR
jgi:outer membrane protease